jgi:ParB family transcriptional regulator, chromosome partitioning protein
MSIAPRRGLRIDDPVGPSVAPDWTDPAGEAATSSLLRELPIAQIQPNPAQPRKHFDDTALAALADSIRERGILQPIIVRPDDRHGFQLIAGERRWRAAAIAGLATIPALVDTDADDPTGLQIALIENVVREDLTPIEEARTIVMLLEDLGLTAGALAQQLGRSRTDLAHTTRLLDLPDEAIDLINTGVISKGHGKALLTEPDHARRRILARRAADEAWSIRTLEAQIAKPTGKRARPEAHPDHAAAAERLAIALTRATGTDATARPHRGGFQILLDQHAAERLHQLLEHVSDIA